MSLPHDEIDPDGLLEYSVVFTDRALNHMSRRFVGVMQEIVDILRTTYRAHTVAVVPGGGTYVMESVARQLATDASVLVVRDGYFSYRWTQIIETGRLTSDVTVMKARRIEDTPQAAWEPPAVEEVVARIRSDKPKLVIAAHVETAAGIMLPDDYLRALADAAHEVGGLFVLDCVASGAMWVDMQDIGVDLLISAPQKGWSGTPCAGFVMMSEAGREAVVTGTTTSFSLDLAKWLSITEGYVDGKAAYHTTMPTDALASVVEVMRETRDRGLEAVRTAQIDLGTKVRAMLAEAGFASVAAPGFTAPTVVVSYTTDPQIQSGAAFKEHGVQIAAGVPLMCDEPSDWSTFRLGLFGLDKLDDTEAAVTRLRAALTKIGDSQR